MDWGDIDTFVIDNKGTKAASKISLWFLDKVNDAFATTEGWNRYKKQTLETSVIYLKNCEDDHSKPPRVLELKNQLCERISIAQNEVTFKR
jgi:hypothetical protein